MTVGRNAMGEYTIDIAEYGVSFFSWMFTHKLDRSNVWQWFPRQLPSDAAAGLAPFDDSDDE